MEIFDGVSYGVLQIVIVRFYKYDGWCNYYALKYSNVVIVI